MRSLALPLEFTLQQKVFACHLCYLFVGAAFQSLYLGMHAPFELSSRCKGQAEVQACRRLRSVSGRFSGGPYLKGCV